MRRGAFVAVLLLLSLGAFSSLGAQEQVVFNLDWVPYGKYVGYYAALGKGFYREAGMDVSFRRGYGNTIKEVVSGDADLGVENPPAMVLGRDQGMKAKLVTVWFDKGMQTLFVLKSSGIKTFKDLEGKSIGVTLGDALHSTFPAVAKAVGLKDFKWVGMEPAVKNPSLLAKKVDAIATYTATQPVLIQMAKKQNDEILKLTWSDAGVTLPSDGIIASEKKMGEKPDQVRRFVAASFKGMAWAIENPEEAPGFFLKLHPEASREIAVDTWKVAMDHMLTETTRVHGIGYIDRKKIEYTRDAMTEAFKLKKKVPLEDIYTTAFQPSPLPKPKAP